MDLLIQMIVSTLLIVGLLMSTIALVVYTGTYDKDSIRGAVIARWIFAIFVMVVLFIGLLPEGATV